MRIIGSTLRLCQHFWVLQGSFHAWFNTLLTNVSMTSMEFPPKKYLHPMVYGMDSKYMGTHPSSNCTC